MLQSLLPDRYRHKNTKSNDQIELSLDDTLAPIANERRRHVISILAEQEHMDAKDLAREIAAIELDEPTQNVSSVDTKRVYIPLIQHHLSTLNDHDMICYDEQNKTLTSNRTTQSVAKLLKYIESITNKKK